MSLIATSRQEIPYSLFPLRSPVQDMENTQTNPETAKHSTALSVIIASMSEPWRQVLGSVEIPEDDGQELAHILTSEGGTIRLWWSDGMVKDGVGAHAYTLQTKYQDDDLAIPGDNVTPWNPNNISSL